MQEDFIYRKVDSKDAEETCMYNNEDERHSLVISQRPSGVKVITKSNEPAIISLGEISYYSNFFIGVHPFIFYGYRIHHSYMDCFLSMFKMHNETANIWTHLLSFVGFFSLTFVLFFEESKVLHEGAILLLFMLSTMVCFISSTVYHLFNCHSEEACKCMFKIDLFGITFQMLSGMICGTYYMFHDFIFLRNLYFSLFLFLSLSALIFTFVPIFISEKFVIVRIIIFSTLFISAFMSCIHWTVIARIEEVEVISKYTLSAFSFVFSGFLFYLSKFPESYYQSKMVDFYFQSHTLWHICVTGSAISYYLMLYNYNLLLLMQQKQFKK